MAALAQIGEHGGRSASSASSEIGELGDRRSACADVVATVYKCIELGEPKLVADALVKLQSPSFKSQVPADMLKLIKSNMRDFYILTMWPLELPEFKMQMEMHFGADLTLNLRSSILQAYHHVNVGKFTKTKLGKPRLARRKPRGMEEDEERQPPAPKEDEVPPPPTRWINTLPSRTAPGEDEDDRSLNAR